MITESDSIIERLQNELKLIKLEKKELQEKMTTFDLPRVKIDKLKDAERIKKLKMAL
jgi:hypothetical protein